MTLCRRSGCLNAPHGSKRGGRYCSAECRRLSADDRIAAGLTGEAVVRFWSKVNKTDTCWLWTGGVDNKGYAGLSFGDVRVLAHRLAWVDANGPVPDGLQLDHLCRVRHCVNPAHLEPVTPGENVRRGDAGAWLAEWWRVQPTCRRGHPWTGENTRVTSRGYRLCRACSRRRPFPPAVTALGVALIVPSQVQP